MDENQQNPENLDKNNPESQFSEEENQKDISNTKLKVDTKNKGDDKKNTEDYDKKKNKELSDENDNIEGILPNDISDIKNEAETTAMVDPSVLEELNQMIYDTENKDNNDSDNKSDISDKKEEQNSRIIALDENFKLLKDYAKYQNEAKITEIENYLEQIKEYQDKQNVNFKFKEIEHDDVIDFTDNETLQFFKNKNFILSENSKKRLNLLYFCIKHGFHILIPGPTGTGKTYLSEAICDLLHINMIKYNCSENTKFPNLKFTCQGDKNKFAGIKYIKGPLLKAITSQNTAFLLDEANLAPIEVLQALEAMIDCGYLVYEDKGKLIKMNIPKDFCFILTLNPSKGKFSGTRQELPESFKNKFISIEFPEMKREELFAITEGASKAFGLEKKMGNKCQNFINDFISFHMEWSKNEKIQDDVACLVIRDILACLHIILEGEDPTETIMNIYGARYIEPIKKEMKEVLLKYDSFQDYSKNYDTIKNQFSKKCFFNKNTLELISTCIFSLKHGRYPIIAGNSGTGKKLLACLLADYFNENIIKTNINNDNSEINNYDVNNKTIKDEKKTVYIVYCTKSSKVEDLMGKPRVSNNKNEDLIQWQDGPLIKAVREGKPLILIGIHELQSSVLEFMNDLLDRKYDNKERFLNNPNNPNEPNILVHKNFRLICTTLLSEINKLSPAFATRMDIKILNDQLEDISNEDLLSLIKTCMNNVKNELASYEEDIQKNINELEEELRKISNDSVNNLASGDLDKKPEKTSKNQDSSSDSDLNEENNSDEEASDKRIQLRKNSDDEEEEEEEESKKKEEPQNKSEGLEKEDERDKITEKIELLKEKSRLIFDEIRINEIIDNKELILEIKKYYETYNNNKNKVKMNMIYLDKFVRSTILIIFKLNIPKEIEIKSLVKLVYDLLFSEQSSFIIDDKIKKFILEKKFIEDPENKYHFIGINKIENYMVSLYLYCTMNIPVYVFGEPGVGKTAGAECLARIRNEIEKLEGNYKKYAFNSATNPSDIYGAESLIDGEVKLIDGPLTESALKGQTFIADEMNLSSNNTMMSLIPIFNTIRNRPIYFPGLQTPIKINPNFWFGAFQNFEGTAGRNATPHELTLKLIRLEYPKAEVEDIQLICIRIRNSIYKRMNPNITDDHIYQLAQFMLELNKKRENGNLASAEAWSIRNLENIINRMAEQQKHQSNNFDNEKSSSFIQYENCSLYINVLFYVMSFIDFELVDELFEDILELILDCFQIRELKDELKKTFNDKTLISYESSTKFFALKKNKAIIRFQNSKIKHENISFYNSVSSLLNTLFNCLLCAETEPILLIGPTGYKTYLVELLVGNVKNITLNEESSIEALLGSTGFFNLDEVKSFYITVICDICIKDKKDDYLQLLKNGKFDKKNIDELKSDADEFFVDNNSTCGKRIVFKDLVDRLINKLTKIVNSSNINDDNILNSIKLEFKPGLFTSAILNGNSLNLRNFDKIPTTTLERFNELFTGMKTLTLNEDKFNTITTPDDKTLCTTVDFIRFFATSLTKNFSEAVLSRWTVINTKEYDFQELEEVLKIFSIEHSLDTVFPDDIKYLIDVAKEFKNESKQTVSIKLLINAIELFNDMNKNLGKFKDSEKEIKENLYYINRQTIYYITFKSIIEQKKEDENSGKNLDKKLYEYLFTSNKDRPNQINLNKLQNPFRFIKKNDLNCLQSLLTNAYIPCIKNEFPKIHPAFTKKFIELLNIIHLGLSLKSTVVLEGEIGQGKQTAIKFLANILGYKLLVIQLSSSNKEEDLLGKMVIDKDKKTNSTVIKVNETDLLKILKNKANTEEKYLIVFNDLQNASDAVKEKIANICDRHQQNVLLPDGTISTKPALNIICVLNVENNSDIRNKLPSPLLYSTIYHKINEIPEEDIRDITYSIFKGYLEENVDKEVNDFIEKFIEVNKILKEMKSRQLLTFNDITKYAKLRAATYKSFNIKLVDNMIFYYRTQDEEIITKIKNKLCINGFDFVTNFSYNTCFTELEIQTNLENGQSLIIKVINPEKVKNNYENLEKKLNTLTSQQNQCLLFLACSWIIKSKVIIKGDTASGKTHCAILFSEMLGANLLTYQMNQDITPSIFTGQSILEEDLNPEEVKSINLYLSEIYKLLPKNSNIIGIIPSDSKKWNPSLFNKFLEIVNDLIMNGDDKNKHIFKEIKTKINSIISPQGRFKETQSQTAFGLKNGSWFLYDDIQFTTPDLLSIMTPLCSDKPSLNLFNAKDSPKFSMEIEENPFTNVELINPNFNLLMTFNQKYCKNSQGLDPILENKCLSFNLLPNDHYYEYCAQIFYGCFNNCKIGSDLGNQLGGKLANIHLFAKKKSLENKELFEGDSIFTSRTINRATKYITKKYSECSIEKLPNIIAVAIDKLYVRPYIEEGFANNGVKSNQLIYREEILKNFNKEIDNYKKSNTDSKFDDNKKLLDQLRDIQISIDKSNKKEFKFNEFVENSLNIKIQHINFILQHIDSTLIFIYITNTNLQSEYINNCYQISIIYKLLINIMKYGETIGPEYNEKKLCDDDLLNINIMKWPIIRLKFLKKLLDNDILPQILKRDFASRTTDDKTDILENKIFNTIIIKISDMVCNKEMKFFENLIKYIFDNEKKIEEINKYLDILIPYYKFNKSDLEGLDIWLPLIIKCFVKKQSFTIHFSNRCKYEHESSYDRQNFSKLSFYFTKKYLWISNSSEYKMAFDTSKSFKISNDSDKKQIFKFYNIVNNILDEKIIINSDKYRKKLKTYESKESFENESIELQYKYFKISDLFENNNPNSVGKLLMVIYNMKYKSAQSLFNLLTSYEQAIFNILLNFYLNYKQENIDKYISFINSLNFYTDNLVIINLEANKNYVSKKIKKFEKSKNKESDKKILENFTNTILEKEKEKFLAINEFTDEIKRDEIVEIYQKYIQEINAKFIENEKEKEKIRLKKQLEDLCKNINKHIKTKNNSNLETYKKALLEQIKSSINREFNPEEYEIYKDKYEQLLKLSQNSNDNNNNNGVSINWPSVYSTSNKSKTSLFLERLVWYSKIRICIDNIKKYNENKDEQFKYILELQEYQEMRIASNLIISTDKLIDKEFNFIYSTLNCNYIMKMVEENLKDYLFNCAKEINKILENNLMLNDESIINKKDYYFIHDKLKEVGNQFLIQIPEFKALDIVFLYLQLGTKKSKNINDYELNEGPILKKIKYNKILDVLKNELNNILNDNFGTKSAKQTAIEIIYTIVRDKFSLKYDIKTFENDIDNKLNEIVSNNNIEDTKKFITYSKLTLYIAKEIDKVNSDEKIKLIYDDMEFLKDDTEEKWYQNSEYITKFPHLIYILSKHEKLYDDLKQFNKQQLDEYKSIPIWIILLRLLANKENILVDYDECFNNLSKRISLKETEYLKNKLIDIKKNNDFIYDTDWLNLCLNDLNNSNLYSRNIRIIFEYILYQIKNFPILDGPISEIFQENITNFNNKIFDLVFNEELENIFDYQFDQEDDLIKLISEPNKFYIDKINEKYNDIITKLINSKAYKDLVKFYKNDDNKENKQGMSFVNPYLDFCNSLKDTYNITLKLIEDEYNKEMKIQIDRALEERKKNIEEIFVYTNDYYEKIIEKIRNEIRNEIEDFPESKDESLNKLFENYNNYSQQLEKEKNYYKKFKTQKYIYFEIRLGNKIKKPITEKSEIYNKDILFQIYNREKIEIDLSTQQKVISHYVLIDDNEDIKNIDLFKLSDNNSEIKLIKNKNKYYQFILFKIDSQNSQTPNFEIKEIKIEIECCVKEICCYDKNDIDVEKIKEDLIKTSYKNKNIKTIKFGQNNSIKFEELFQLLEKFNENNLKFSKDLCDIINNKKINIENIMNSVTSLINEQDNISKHLKSKCSDDTPFPKIDNKLLNIQNYFSQLKPLFSDFISYIKNNIKDFIESYNNNKNKIDSLFKNNNIKNPVSQINPKFSFKTIDPDSKYLATLIISEENKEVTCSQSQISGDLGKYIPSLLKGDFSIYILSTVNAKLSARMDFPKDSIYKKNVLIKDEIEPNELFVINIKIPKKFEENDELIDINFDLFLGNDNLKEIKLPCKFNFILSSLKIKISCLNYDLIMNNDEIFLGTNYLEENENIQFEVKCKNENTSVDFKFTYHSNEDNEAKEPNLNKDKKIVNLRISKEYEDIDITDDNYKARIFNAILKIHITNDLFIPININAQIIPFRFKIMAYDFNSPNPVEKELIVYHGIDQLKEEQKLFFQIKSSNGKKSYKGNIKLLYNEDNIEIINKSLEDQFEISNPINFNIIYKLKQDYMNNNQLKIVININSFEKEFCVIFQKAPNIIDNNAKIINKKDYANILPLYHYKLGEEGKYNLEKLSFSNMPEVYTNIFASPFDITKIHPFKINFQLKEFNFLINRNNNYNSFYILSNNGNLKIDQNLVCKWEIEKISNNIFKSFFNWIKGDSEKNNYLVTKTLPIIGEYKGVWYPLLTNYELNIDKYNKITNTNNTLSDDKSESFISSLIKNNSEKYTIYALGNLLIQDNVFKNISEIIGKLPEEIGKLFYEKIGCTPISDQIKKMTNNELGFDILDKIYQKNSSLFQGTIFQKIKDTKDKDRDLKILKKNVIYTLMVIFKERNAYLEKNGNRDFILLKKEDKELFEKQIKEMRENYFFKNKEPEIKDNPLTADELSIARDLLKDFHGKKQNYLHDKEVFKEIRLNHYNNKFEQFFSDPADITDLNITMQEDNTNPSSSTVLSSDINLPDLNRPENDLTLNKLIDFYNNAIKCTRILPIFIGNAIKKDDKNIEKAEESFILLFNTYRAVKYKNYSDTSFLKDYVNDFIFSFEKMISKLKKAGLNIQGMDHISNIDEENVNEILKCPEKDVLIEKNNLWNINKKTTFINKDTPIYDFEQYKHDEDNFNKNNENNYFYTDNLDTEAKIEDEINNNEANNIQTTSQNQNQNSNRGNNFGSNFAKEGSNIKVESLDAGDNGKDSEQTANTGTYDSVGLSEISTGEKREKTGEDTETKDKDKDKTNMKLNSNAENTITIDPKGFGNNEKLFNEEEGISKSILKIKKIDENFKFSLDYVPLENYYPDNIESQKILSNSFKSFVESSHHLSKKFIEYFTDSNIPFLNEGISILIDCSGYINKSNKLFNMYIICGLTEGLNAVGMKYSVALISDEKYKRIIKKYDTPHNMFELQKIYECYMIPRYRTNLAKSIHFAIDNLKFKSEHHKIYNINSNTAFIIFTDGMDENLFFGKEFRDNLFNNPNLSFGFIFIKSSLLSDNDNNILQNLWSNFVNSIKGSKSKIQIEITENKFEINKIYNIIKMFVNILSRDIKEENYDLGNYILYDPIFELPYKEELDSNSLNDIKIGLKSDFSKLDKIFYCISQIHYNKYKADKLNTNLYNNKTGNIINCKVSDSIKNEYNKFLKDFIIPKNNLDNISILDQIFMPNKASTMVLSSTGSEIDIPAFIKYLFENNPNPMIYLEKKGGFTKHYSVSIIIDCSYSCLNNFSFPHTIQLIRTLISNISAINIPAVDIIIATSENPIVICSDVPSNKLLGKINVLSSIFKILSRPCLKANLVSALKVAKDLQKICSKDTTKYMLVFTDGLYQQNELELIKNKIFDCMQTSSVIGVGVGFFPLKIKKLFIQSIYVQNPNKLFSAIGISAAKSNDKFISTMPYLPNISNKPKSDIIDELLKTDKPINKDLIEEIKNIEIEMDAFSDIYNPESEEYDESGKILNPTGSNKSMFAEGILEGHKILFVCLYNCDMNPNEDPNTNYIYLTKTSPKTYFNLKQCADYYKVEIKLVLDYEDAIKELTEPWEKDHSKCKYYATWVLCGPPYPLLPNNPNKKNTNPYLIGQFIEVIHKFNENGGSLVFLTESDPLFYQANLFLRDLELYDKNGKKVKVDLQLEGEHKGDTILKGDKTGQLNTAGLFNKSSQSFANLTRASLSHNLFTYYEGYTIDYADYNKVMNSPFYPFARDSDGGVAGFFYPSDIDERGDLIFNCNYTSLYFTKTGSNAKNDGTYKYFENIIVWTARPEVHQFKNRLIKDYRPKRVNYTINKNDKWTEFKKLPKKEITIEDLKKMKTLFCIDASGSVSRSSLYHNITKRIFNEFYKSGDLIYLWGDSFEKKDLNGFRSWNDQQNGHLDGTASELIADIISKEINCGIEHLVIITDGSVNTNSIKKSDEKMVTNNYHFQFVSVYIITKYGGDRTVGAPYCRGDPSVTYIYRDENKKPEKLASLSNEQIDLVKDFDKIASYNEFILKYEKLGFALEAQMYGKDADKDLLNKINTMKSNILKSPLTQKENDDLNKKIQPLIKMCNGALLKGDFQFKAY